MVNNDVDLRIYQNKIQLNSKISEVLLEINQAT